MFSDRTNWNLRPNRLADTFTRHRVEGRRLLDLTASNPTQCGFAYDERAILAALSNPSALTYEPQPRGLEIARHSVAQYYADAGVSVPVDDLILTTSTSEAYTFAFRALCNPGDEILIPQPSYPLFELLAEIQDVKLVRYSLVYDHGWQIDFHSLERTISPRARAVVVVNPNNPTGNYVRSVEFARLNAICFNHGLAILADEVFSDYGLTEAPRLSFASNVDLLTFTMSGVSKICGLPQMKIAWLIAGGPKDLKTEVMARLEVVADTYLSMSAPAQYALPEFLKGRHAIQKQISDRVVTNLQRLDALLGARGACSRLKFDAGWYAVIRVPATRSDEDLAIDLLTAHDVYVHPGHFYDFGSEGYLVVSLITPTAVFSEGIERIFSVF